MTTTAPPITFGVIRQPDGRHEQVRVWAGTSAGGRGLIGKLTVTEQEGAALEQRLLGPDLTVEDLEVLTDALFMRSRHTGSDGIRAAAVELQERLQAEIDRRTTVPVRS